MLPCLLTPSEHFGTRPSELQDTRFSQDRLPLHIAALASTGRHLDDDIKILGATSGDDAHHRAGSEGMACMEKFIGFSRNVTSDE
jgi:hypothetical protein